MKPILAIALTDVRSTFTERSMWFVTFLMPILFTAVLASATSGGGGDERATLHLVNQDGGPLGAQVEAALRGSAIVRLAPPVVGQPAGDEAAALAHLDDYGRVLVLPTRFSEALAAGEPVEPLLYLSETADPERTRAVQQALAALFTQAGAAALGARLATEQAAARRPFNSEAERQSFYDEALRLAQARLAEGTVSVRRERATPLAQPATGAAQASPGQLVTFALVTLLSTSSVLVYERTIGTLRRLLTAPVSRATILTGKTLGRLLVGLAQMAVLILFGWLVFDVQWGRSPLALVALLLAFALAAVGLGLLLATIARTTEQANQMTTAAALLLAAMGGAWWSLELTQGPIRALAMVLPTGWAMDGFQAILLRGAALPDVLPHVAVLLGFALLFFTLGTRRLRFE